MAIPSSGALSAQTINFELARSRSAELSIDTAENGGYATINTSSPSRPNSANPAAYSEWYSYNHTAGGITRVPVTVGYDSFNQNRACSNFYFSPIVQFVPAGEDFVSTTVLFTTLTGPATSRAGWYSDGGTNKQWNGAVFVSAEPCIL